MDTYVFLSIGISNAIIGLLYFIVLIIKRERTKAFLIFLFILLCPMIGIIMLSLSWLLNQFLEKKELNLEELSFNTEKLDMVLSPDYEKEINVVPIEEALIISDTHNKRKVILDVLKEDYNKSITMITGALENEDSETSHYVATVIADVKSNFKVTVQRMKEKLDKIPNDTEITLLMLDYIHNFLEKKVLSEIEELTYIEQYEQLMVNLYDHDAKAVTSSMYKQIIYHLLGIGKSSEALLWGERALLHLPEELDTYNGILKLYFETGDKTRFMEALKRLKASDIEYDNEYIDMFDFYQI